MNGNIKILYQLTEDGQRNSLLNNGDGKKAQVIEVEIDKYPELLEMSSIKEDGEVILDTYSINFDCELKPSNISLNNKHYILEINRKVFDKEISQDEIIKWIMESKKFYEERFLENEKKRIKLERIEGLIFLGLLGLSIIYLLKLIEALK